MADHRQRPAPVYFSADESIDTPPPAGLEQQWSASVVSSPSLPANRRKRRWSRTRSIRSAHSSRKRQATSPRKQLESGTLRRGNTGKHSKPPPSPNFYDSSLTYLPSYEELFFPEVFPTPRRPSLSDLPPGLLYRRALKYLHGIDTGAPVIPHPVITATMAASIVTSISRLGGANRTSVISSAHSKSNITVDTRPVKEKYLMSGNGISCSFELAEPVVYLTGFQRDLRNGASQSPSAIIRGKLVLNVQKSVKIKAITVRFYGKSRTDWPEGIPPEKTQFFEEEKIRYQVLPFFNALYSGAEVGYGAHCQYVLKNKEASTSTTSLQDIGSASSHIPRRSPDSLGARDQRRLSMQNVQQRSFNRSESSATTTQQKGYKTFHPGTYQYSFELPMDHTCPETMNLPYGKVKWILEAIVERAGTFKPNLHGQQEITVVRAPDENSTDAHEPIAISRNWEDQLHYEICVSGKSFPIGGKIPVAIKLTPLAKVACHRIRVFATENIDYYCRGRKVTRRENGARVCIFDRFGGKDFAPEFAGSKLVYKAGGEVSALERAQNRRNAESWRAHFAKLENPNGEPAPLPPPSDNMLGDIDLGLESLFLQTEIEMEVQMPTCAMMNENRKMRLHPNTGYQNVVVHHWIKVVLRLSKIDPEDPTGLRRKHFEISVDSPFVILSCLSTANHTSLPQYQVGPTPRGKVYECGCPNAAALSPASSTGSIPGGHPELAPDPALGADGAALPQLAVPPRAHVASTSEQPEGAGQRPIHLLRVPSYNPPAFSAEDPPPALETPPPMYDHVVGTPSVDGLADYFARLSEYDDPKEGIEDAEGNSSDEDDQLDRTVTRHGAVNVPNPRTPGGRTTSRSMDVSRDFMFRPEEFTPRLQRARAERSPSQSEPKPNQPRQH